MWPRTFAACLERVSGLSCESAPAQLQLQDTELKPKLVTPAMSAAAPPAAEVPSKPRPAFEAVPTADEEEDVGVPITAGTPSRQSLNLATQRPTAKRPAPSVGGAGGGGEVKCGKPAKPDSEHPAAGRTVMKPLDGPAGDARPPKRSADLGPSGDAQPAKRRLGDAGGPGAGLAAHSKLKSAPSAGSRTALKAGGATPPPAKLKAAAGDAKAARAKAEHAKAAAGNYKAVPAANTAAAKNSRDTRPAATAPVAAGGRKSLFSELLPAEADW